MMKWKQAERLEAMERELAFLELASRQRERASEQREAVRRLDQLIAKLGARLNELPARS